MNSNNDFYSIEIKPFDKLYLTFIDVNRVDESDLMYLPSDELMEWLDYSLPGQYDIDLEVLFSKHFLRITFSTKEAFIKFKLYWL